jgi:26S proteasome regulatory subunit N5
MVALSGRSRNRSRPPGPACLLQIYLEVPRARVTRILSQIKEQAGDVNAASELMQELQVETFGSMERREKVDFILEQMRLLKEQEDFEKMAIVAKRINLKWLADAENEVRSPLPPEFQE